jgi:hypothetical protein
MNDVCGVGTSGLRPVGPLDVPVVPGIPLSVPPLAKGGNARYCGRVQENGFIEYVRYIRPWEAARRYARPGPPPRRPAGRAFPSRFTSPRADLTLVLRDGRHGRPRVPMTAPRRVVPRRLAMLARSRFGARR